MGKHTLAAPLLALSLMLAGCAGNAAVGPAPDAAAPAPATAPAATDAPAQGSGKTPVTQEEGFPFEIDADGFVLVPQSEWGYEIGLPREAVDEDLINISEAAAGQTTESHPIPGLYRLYIDFLFPELMARMDTEALDEDAFAALIRTLAHLNIFDRAEYDAQIAAGKTPDAIVGEGQSREVARQEGYVYIYTLLPKDTAGMDEGTRAKYERVYEKTPQIGDKIRAIPIEAPVDDENLGDADAPESVPAFQAADLAGNAVSSDIFQKQKLTMVNLWATFCGPCIEEMPDLATLARNMPAGSQLVGVICDAEGNEELARQILTESGADASFQQIVPDAALTQMCLAFPYVPTTIFVDADGKLVGEPLVGGHTEAEYRKEIESRLAGLAAGT